MSLTAKRYSMRDTYPLDYTGKNIVWENMANHYRRLYCAKPKVDTNLRKTVQQRKNIYSAQQNAVRPNPPKQNCTKDSPKINQSMKIGNITIPVRFTVNKAIQTQNFNGYRPIDKKSVRFLRDITDEALKRGAYTDFTLERIFIKHDKKNKYNLSKALREKELNQLRSELGMPIKIKNVESEQNENRKAKDCEQTHADNEAVDALNTLLVDSKMKHNILGSLGISSPENVLVKDFNEPGRLVKNYGTEKDEKILKNHVSFKNVDVSSESSYEESIKEELLNVSEKDFFADEAEIKTYTVLKRQSPDEIKKIEINEKELPLQTEEIVESIDSSSNEEAKDSSVSAIKEVDIPSESSNISTKQSTNSKEKNVEATIDKNDAENLEQHQVLSEAQSEKKTNSDGKNSENVDDQLSNNDDNDDFQPDTTSELSSIHTELE
ncbi:uncharacterized protein LOC106661471 isoform X1 [Cimex lectularius]|uniref:Uncharacterized protein n=2 Tax=Cimex lectularius TaxID=79782 RepID=A0A8I6TBC8_CIMLE|nr:uncharacterized protein LOC106661471 isoform X1 [Cimex lectularius]